MSTLPEKQRVKPKKEMREEMRDVLEGLNHPEPHVAMAYYMAGVDPRQRPGQLYSLLKQCHERREDGRPRPEDWEAAWEFISTHPALQGEFVDQATSYAATKDMLPYIHPKLKAVHVSGELAHKVQVVPLTPEDVELLEERLRHDF